MENSKVLESVILIDESELILLIKNQPKKPKNRTLY
jgi:hypothetical protein